MRNWGVEHWTSTAGLAGTALQVVAFVVFLIGAGSPPSGEAELTAWLRAGNVPLQTSFLLFFAGFVAWFVFFAGFRAMIATAAPRQEFLGTAVFGLGAATLILGFVMIGMEAAGTANAFTRPDNAVAYSMYMGGSVLDGAPTAVTVVAFIGVAGWALSQTRMLGGWTVWLSAIIAVIVGATIPALYQGDELSGTFSADGLVAEVLVFIPMYVWSSAISIAILRKALAPRHEAVGERAQAIA